MPAALKNKVAVVTGAASGIGRASALRLARGGARLALVDIDEKGLAAVEAEIQDFGGVALTIAGDCADIASCKAAMAITRKTFGPVDILLNNVGQSARERSIDFATADLSTLDFMIELNLKSCIVWSREAVDDMRPRGSGKIINIASEAAFTGAARSWDYAAAKGGVVGFTRAIARELAPFGIAVNAIGPGLTRTRAFDQMPKASADKIVAGVPMGRIGEPEEIANVVAFFASDQSSYVTGQTLLVNGGNWLL